MKKQFLAILIVSFQAFLTPVSAQLNSNNLTVYNELEGTVIHDIITDRMGVIWMATDNGLVRFDGYEYKHYDVDPNDSKTMGSILTQKLFVAQNGHIWIGSIDMLSEYNPDTESFKNYNLLKLTDFPLGELLLISTINEDLGGRIYFGVLSVSGIIGSNAVFYKDKNNDQLQRFDSPNKLEVKNVYKATADKLGNIWILAQNGFFRIDKNKNIHKEECPIDEFERDKYYSTIKSDAKGNIWITSSKDIHSILSVWNPSTGKMKSYPLKQLFTKEKESFHFIEMEIDSSGNIWIGADKGLIYFDLKKEQFEIVYKSPDIKSASNILICLHLDSFGNLWMGTPSQGLLRYTNRAVLKSYVYKKEDKNSITAGWVFKMFENSEGKIWMASESGLDVFDPATSSLTPYPSSVIMPGTLLFNGIGLYSPQEILFQTNQGYFLFNTKNRTCKKTILDPKLDKLYFLNLKNDSKGNQWYCTNNGAFLKIKNKKTLQHIDLNKLSGSNGFSNAVINIYDSPKYGLWLLTNNGLFLYNYTTNKVERYGFDKKKGDVFKSQDINSLYVDKEGILWVGTWGGGLSKYNIKTGKIKNYAISDGLPSMSIQGILPDEKNKALWLSTFNGISRFSIEEEQFNNFSVKDGVQGRSFADGSCVKTSEGLMLFGGNNGIAVFNPNDISKNSTPPKVFITDFKIDDISIYYEIDSIDINKKQTKNDFVLKYNQNSISINYTGIHYANPASNKFAYKLESYADNWRDVGAIRTAFYYNLPPGDYTFRVKAANSNGVWNETGASVHFSIAPPWWRTWWAYGVYFILLIIGIWATDHYQRRRLIKRERVMAQERELEQAKEIEKAYHELQTTQAQLIQSEKMASLGELTAGIAHEIQNPLNFVNNFSEVNTELIGEMEEEIDKGNLDEAKKIAKAIRENQQKINHHGKRADAIVKGMLQHSRSSNGIKEPTNINALADEYLRLAYHGLRAKDKSFNAKFETDFDENLGKINVIPQDMGRVILNLLTNAFYAVTEKKKALGDSFQPAVTISTKKAVKNLELRVTDNGNGIPAKIIDKIFQPFFSSKPTGAGTGLGLSMCYEIVTKGHGGKIEVESKEGERTEMIVTIPI